MCWFAGGLRDDSHKGSKQIQYLYRIARDLWRARENGRNSLRILPERTSTQTHLLLKSCVLRLILLSPTAMPTKLDGVGEIFVEEQDIACSAMIFAYFVEIQTHKLYTALLDELDKRMTLRRTTRGTQLNVHWSNGGPAYYISKAKDKVLIIPMLCRAIRFIQTRVRESENQETGRESGNCVKASQLQRSLLYFALSPFARTLTIQSRSRRNRDCLIICYKYTFRTELVALLLALGEDPNQITDGTTP